MDCSRARTLLHPWLDGELDREAHREVVEHLGRCEHCDARFKDEQRLLAHVKKGIEAPCPLELKARLFAQVAAAAPVAAALPRGGAIISFRRAAAAAAVFAIAFVWTDPICLRGCPTVRALAIEHRESLANVSSSSDAVLAQVQSFLGEPVPECEGCAECMGLSCEGWDRVRVCKKGCMIRFKDREGHTFSFVKMKDGHVHRWLQITADRTGLITTKQDGCRFAGWKEPDGDMCGFICDESVAPDELVALSEKARAR